jgi:phosphopantetheine--protein transferase-like protein
MKRNLGDTKIDDLQAFAASIKWALPPAPGIAVAAFIDDGRFGENDLASFLSTPERNKAGQMPDPVERRHFIFRRCFQRFFLKVVVDWKGALPDLRVEHNLDTQPFCPDASGYHLSFSSSGSTALACAALNHRVGIDIEKVRAIENALELANRFFTAGEAASLSKSAGLEQNLCFLQLWTAKEAGLKAIGKGIVSGLNSFVVTPSNHSYGIEMIRKSGTDRPWTLHYLDLVPSHIVAVVHSPGISLPDSL